MTGEKIRAVRKDHNNKPNKNEEITDTYDETSNGTIPNGTGNHCKSNKVFQKAAKTSTLQQQQQQQQHNANNINGNPSSVDTDSNKNPIISLSSEEDVELPVHECVFKGDVRLLSSLIRTHSITQKDVHGNTPLHLAVMMGHKECALLLLAHNAPVKIKNAQGWSPLAEAISYGDRQMSELRERRSDGAARPPQGEGGEGGDGLF
ncbi:Ankyrin repeat domain-containing protein 13C-A [Liparis tanakae]|uniref:Ankyrin repeat domain-containing protein 13C-A n=1 Tax=Liparis tanakae TaxID=230148 RepID=A0A4Z2HGR7_9TELE|nr:Ankyrin repeat domain-containing protein 13C-A [Liparis tanakae]